MVQNPEEPHAHGETDRNPRWRVTVCLVLFLLGVLLSPQAQAQLILERTIAVNQTITDRGQYVSSFSWSDAGLSSVSRVTASLSFSEASVARPPVWDQFYGSLTHGTASETERMAVLFSPGSPLSGLAPSYTVESALDGAWLASNSWSLLVADQVKGGGGMVWNNWKLRVEGEAAVGGTIAVHSGGSLLLGAANQISDTTQVTMAGGTVALAGYNETAGRLAVSADSIFDFGTAGGGANTFTFADFQTSAYGGAVLTIQNAAVGSSLVFQYNYSGDTTFNNFASKVQFGEAGQYGQISFGGGEGALGTTTLLVAIPDARVAMAAALLIVLIGGTEVRRRWGIRR